MLSRLVLETVAVHERVCMCAYMWSAGLAHPGASASCCSKHIQYAALGRSACHARWCCTRTCTTPCGVPWHVQQASCLCIFRLLCLCICACAAGILLVLDQANSLRICAAACAAGVFLVRQPVVCFGISACAGVWSAPWRHLLQLPGVAASAVCAAL
jgi:hypothetical protein